MLVKISDFQIKKTGNKNRGCLEIVKDMLSVATQKCKKTQILYDAHLNYLLLEKYLKILLKNKLIETDNSFYLITSKGKIFLQEYEDYLENCSKIIKEIAKAQKQKIALKDFCSNKKQDSNEDSKECWVQIST